MTATFRPGNHLIIEPVHIASDVGEVVLHTDQVAQVLWVVVTPDGLVTRGDSMPRADAVVVTADNLLGTCSSGGLGIKSPG